jgi:general secretion pathway protein J
MRRTNRYGVGRGFTLIELLVAVSIMSLMTIMAWRALNGMQQATMLTRDMTDNVLTLEAGLSQWGADLDAMIELPETTPIEWDGKAMRMTRHHSADPSEGVIVVGWTRSNRNGSNLWLRWQSEPVRSRQEWRAAWQAAGMWAQSPTEASRQREVALMGITQWQIYYFRGGSWSNPLSSSGTGAPVVATPGANLSATTNIASVPDGVRLMISVSAPHPLAGNLVRDWARPHASESGQ